MINEIKIQSFKSLQNVTVDLGWLNVFVGANGSGKSNFLEAVGLLSTAVAGVVNDQMLGNHGVRTGTTSRYLTSFSGRDLPKSVGFQVKGVGVEYQVNLTSPNQSTYPNWGYVHEILTQMEVIKGENNRRRRKKSVIFDRQNRSRNFHFLTDEQGLADKAMAKISPESNGAKLLSRLREFLIYSPSTEVLRNSDNETQKTKPLGLHGGSLAETLWSCFMSNLDEAKTRKAILPFLRLIDWAKSASCSKEERLTGNHLLHSSKNEDDTTLTKKGYRQALEPGDLWNPKMHQRPISFGPAEVFSLMFHDRYMEEKYAQLSAQDVSEGALLIMFLAGLLVHPFTPSFCAVDNADYGLNPQLVRSLFGKISERVLELKGRKQLLLTTHNPLVLDGLRLNHHQIRLFAVDRDNDGATHISPVVIDQRILDLAQKGIPLSQMWIEGYFGGVFNDI